MPEKQPVVPDDMQNLVDRFGYYPGVIVGNELTISGQVGRDPDLNVVEGKEAQFVQAFENVRKILNEAGVGFDEVVEMTTYHTDMRHLQDFIDVKDRYFVDDYPTWTGIGVSSLAMEGLIVEIQCRAILPD